MDDERCCGTGTCIINAEGYCWCGQKWDGQKMCFPQVPQGSRGTVATPASDAHASTRDAAGQD